VIGATAFSASLLAVSLGLWSHVSAPARLTLSASPTHVALVAGARRAVRVTARGARPLVVQASVAGLGLDLGGRPRIVHPGDATPWISVSPHRLTVDRGGAALVVSSRRAAGARPGDHSAVVLLTAVAQSAGGVVVRMRIGLVVSVRVAGALVHRLEVRAARVRRSGRARLIELSLANRGNVIESIGPGRLEVTLVRRGRVVAQLRSARREILPRSKGIVDLRYGGSVRGVVVARVELGQPPGRRRVRSFAVRL
jgi:hypothetical protein